MLAFLAAKTGLSKTAVAMFVWVALLAIAALGARSAAASFRAVVDQAAVSARKERDAHWQAEIAKANEIVAKAHAATIEKAARAEAEIRATETRLETVLKDLETRNAALPDGARCGLGRDRVRLLNGAR